MSERPLPSGTVTFLFTDIEGSTPLWDAHPAEMEVALARHDDLLRRAIESHGGYVFATGGDGFAVAFATAGDAVAAAVEAQRALGAEEWTDPVQLRVRMGIHTGEVQERGGDYYGPAINRAARLMGAAHGGQLVVSALTAGLVDQTDDVTLIALGQVELKGVVEPVEVFGVSAAGLDWLDRPLVSTQPTAGNLPRLQTDLVGDLASLQQRVADLPRAGLVTLTGSGGVGKTRAAIEIGWLVVDEFSGGVWLVELAPVANLDAAIPAVASTLSVQPQPDMSAVESIIDWCLGRRMLLILDNCEHVLDPVLELVEAIGASCPTVTILATSREPLGASGEQVVRIPSLDSERSVKLFCNRAGATDNTFLPSADDLAAIGAICERLDGIPLAIELAAARTRSLSPTELLARLDDRFRLLRGGGRGGLERHQTLRAAVTWSYQLLSNEERLLFDRLSVFAGTFDLAAAEAVCADEHLDELDVVDLIGGLVDKSMLIADRTEGATRYRELETLRQYGEERLDDRGETAVLRDRHLHHYLGAADQLMEQWMSPEQVAADQGFAAEWDNLRAAHSWTIVNEDLRTSEAVVIASGWHAVENLIHEHREWTQRTVNLADRLGRVSPSSLGTAALWAFYEADMVRVVELAERGAAADPDVPYVGGCLAMELFGHLAQGHVDEIQRLEAVIEDRLERAPAVFDEFMMRIALGFSQGGRPDADLARLEAMGDHLGDPMSLARIATIRGNAKVRADPPQYESAMDDYREAIRLGAGGAGSSHLLGYCNLADVQAVTGHPEAAGTVRQAVARTFDARFWFGVDMALGACALHLVENDPEAAAMISGHVSQRPKSIAGLHSVVGDRTRAAVAEMANGETWMANGAQTDRHRIVAYALERLSEATPP